MRRRDSLSVAIVLGIQTLGAALIYVFMMSDNIFILCGILALATITFVILQRYRHIEDWLVACFREGRRAGIVFGLIIALTVPLLIGNNVYVTHILVISMIFVVLALALNFQIGSANIPNFAIGASYGIGAYASALVAVEFGVNFWLALAMSGVLGTSFGFILGLPCMRTHNFYTALVTIASTVVVHQLINNFEFTGGPRGIVNIPAPTLFGHSFRDPISLFSVYELPRQANYYYLALALVLFTILVAKRLHASRIGLAWNALREDEIAARAQGINVTWYKILAFAVDAGIAGLAGTIYAFYIGYISPDNFTFLVSVTIMTMVIVGGIDNIFGVIVGAVLLTVLPEKFRVFEDYRLLFFGAIVILMLIVRPQGLFPQRLRSYGGGG